MFAVRAAVAPKDVDVEFCFVIFDERFGASFGDLGGFFLFFDLSLLLALRPG